MWVKIIVIEYVFFVSFSFLNTESDLPPHFRFNKHIAKHKHKLLQLNSTGIFLRHDVSSFPFVFIPFYKEEPRQAF